MREGLADRSEKVGEACAHMICNKWLLSDADHIQFIGRFDVLENEV